MSKAFIDRTSPSAPGSGARVLLVEDDADVRESTRMILERHGFSVRTADDGRTGFAALKAETPDVAVIDIGMPEVDGLTLTRMVRSSDASLPIILLTARDLTSDMVRGLSMGADDYITKPFDGAALVARIHALLRRTRPEVREIERIGRIQVDRAAMVVRNGTEEIALTATEFRILELFLDHRGRVLSRRQILEHVWGGQGWTEERVVNVHIQRLRAKLSEDVILTVRGTGYRAIGT
ncbi:response regulator transcription factor [Paeniglutamicibacter sp. R2-26]|uniref:response regulator transcription factor n=1 Tax=Paeniglutamicibacter sp. R2-26 TaxID=3144417 RepID=UPI003EE5A623